MSGFRFRHAMGWLGVFLLSMPLQVQATEPLCAVVVIQIEQEVAFERQAFKAKMEISNALEGIDLENVNVEVLFTDAAGNPVEATSNTSSSSASFFITVDKLEGISGISGNGTVEADTVANIEWLIIPTEAAANGTPSGELFFVGATLSYTYGGKEDQISVAPDTIVVKPLPDLQLEYFLTEDVIGDDAFTTQIEPPVPYTLGLRVVNRGFGAARNFTIESAQPEIVENELGLAIGFKIIGSYVNEEPATESLLVDLGDVLGNSVATARWIMETTLSGRFIDIKADFSHAEALGGDLTSLIDSVTAHLMVRDVRVQLPGRDNRRDFLVEKAGSFYVYESELTGADLTVCLDCIATGYYPGATLGAGNGSNGYFVRTLTISGLNPQAPAYVKVDDPYFGAKDILSVRRDDGLLLHPDNFWISQERALDNVNFDYFVSLFDAQPSASYTITFVDKNIPERPPVFIPVNPVVVAEGQQAGFLVRADDPNGDAFTLKAVRMPAGATFALDNPEQGVFLWETSVGMAGEYQAVFEADDRLGVSQLIVPITVLSPEPPEVDPNLDTDGDGIPDVVELRWGLDPEDPSDALLDADGDGFSNLEEWLAGSDPFDGQSTPISVASLLYADHQLVSGAVLSVAESKDGRFIYAVETDQLRRYERDLLTGELTLVQTLYGEKGSQGRLYTSVSGEYVYLVSPGDAAFSVYRVDAVSGELVRVHQFLSGFSGVSGLTESADGQYVYVATYGSNNRKIQVFNRNEAGLLDLLQSLDVGAACNCSPYELEISEEQDVLFSSNSGKLVAFSRDVTTGELGLTPLATFGWSWAPRVLSRQPGTNNLYYFTSSMLVGVRWTGSGFANISGGAYGANGFSSNYSQGLIYISRSSYNQVHVIGLADVTGAISMRGTVTDGVEDALGNVVDGMRSPTAIQATADGRHVYVSAKDASNNWTLTVFRHDRFFDVDADGIADHLDPDIDGDGVANEQDAMPHDAAESADTDGDGVGDNSDAFPSDPAEWRDTDGDGVGDNADLDSDGDGLPNAWEQQHGLNPFDAVDAVMDQDNDGLTNLQELQHGTDPNNPDTDGDGGLDGDETVKGTNPLFVEPDIDSDANSCPNHWELSYGYDVYDAALPSDSVDADADGLSDYQECLLNGNPASIDTDNDGVNDYVEVQQGTRLDISQHKALYVDHQLVSGAVLSVAESKDGRFIYAVETDQLRRYERDLLTGELTLVQTLYGEKGSQGRFVERRPKLTHLRG